MRIFSNLISKRRNFLRMTEEQEKAVAQFHKMLLKFKNRHPDFNNVRVINMLYPNTYLDFLK